MCQKRKPTANSGGRTIKRPALIMKTNNNLFLFDLNKPIIDYLRPIVKRKGVWVIKKQKKS